MAFILMANQGYKRTNFEEDEYTSNGPTTPPMDFAPANVVFRGTTNRLNFPSWKQRSIQEKVLLILLAALTLVVIIMAGVMALKDARVKELTKANQKYCLTENCVKIASGILTSMDRTADPCQDFYQYACGGWMRSNPIPSGHSRWGTFELMSQKNLLVMKNAIDKPDSALRGSAEVKAKHYFQSCMDDNKLIEKAGAKPLLSLLDSLSWGLNLTNWDSGWELPASWSFNKMLEDTHLLQVPTFFMVWVGEDDKNSSVNVLQVDQSGLGLPERSYYLNASNLEDDKYLSAYLKYMTTIMDLLGAPNKTYTRERMIEVIQLETEMANFTIPEENRRDEQALYHVYTLANLTHSFPQIQWLHLVNHLLNVTNTRVQPTERVIVYAPEYLSELNKLISRYLQTNEGKRTINNYLLWHLIKDFAVLLSKPYRNAKKEFSEALLGLKGSDEPWHICVMDTDSVLGFALGSLFVKDTFEGSSKKTAETMISNVLSAFKSSLYKLDWMDPFTRAATIDKADSIYHMIGYPEYILNTAKLDKKYRKLAINQSDYFGNNLASIRFGLETLFEKLRKRPDKSEWSMSPPTVNAYYTAGKNSIVFPAGILQAPFFDKTFPKSLNYGAMGVVMGHELMHAFDDQGREFDKFGNMRRWWKNETVKKYTERTRCMERQYSQYRLHGDRISGKRTLGENIADNGGLKHSYHAYQNWVKENGKEQLLPALGLNHEQLFFLSFAQVWCWNSKSESDHMQIMTDPHTPAKYRVIGPLSNSYEFSKVFKCSKKSRMNPKSKCQVL